MWPEWASQAVVFEQLGGLTRDIAGIGLRKLALNILGA
jgi:hypothetical protein